MTARPAAILAAALALSACGGNAGKEALAAYEASVEKLMEEDGKVTGRLTDLAEDLPGGGAAAAAAQTAYDRDEAAPFYGRFKEAAAKAPAAAEKLQKVHSRLLEYLDHRLAYLRAVDSHIAAKQGEAMGRLEKAQASWDAAMTELREKTGGKLADPGVIDAYLKQEEFLQKGYPLFKAGDITAEDLEAVLRKEILPRFARIAERTKGQIADEGAPGAVARWAAVELAFFQELAATIPQQAQVHGSWKASKEEWEASAKAREEYISGLRSYRDGLR